MPDEHKRAAAACLAEVARDPHDYMADERLAEAQVHAILHLAEQVTLVAMVLSNINQRLGR